MPHDDDNMKSKIIASPLIGGKGLNRWKGFECARFFIVLIASMLLWVLDPTGQIGSPQSVPTPDLQAQSAKEVPVENIESSPATLAAILVTRIIDGDTIELENGEKVRYIGVDTPEKSGNECFNKEATAINRELVEGKKVTLIKDVSERDRYGRLLRYVYVDDLFVNLELVQQGFAQASTYPPDVKFQTIFQTAQETARQANLGLCQPVL